MKAHEARKLLDDLPESTLRKYAQDYAEYLSPFAGRRHREYTDQDVRILRLIVEMKAKRQTQDDIDVTLRSLEAGDWQQLPELPEAAQALVPTESSMIALQTKTSGLQREIEVLREMLDKEREDRSELLQRIGRLEAQIELYESGRLTPPKTAAP